ncbi:unnamed protein product, partial [Candidula unifasciata]
HIFGCCRQLSTSNKHFTDRQYKDYAASRVVKKLAVAKKRTGQTYQAPSKDYYHKLLQLMNGQHFGGEKVLSASTSEWAILCCTDHYASIVTGKILALVFLKLTSLVLQAFKEANIALTEPAVIEAEYRPGINYDKYRDSPSLYEMGTRVDTLGGT